MICTLFMMRVFVRHRRSENSPAKFYLFPERVLPLQKNPPVTLQHSPAAPPFLN